MKPKNSALFSVMIFSLLLSCNGNKQEVISTDKKITQPDSAATAAKTKAKFIISTACKGVYNLTIGKDMADKMRNKYKEVFSSKAPGLLEEEWIDEYVIRIFAEHLKDDKYDGVRFVNVCNFSGKSKIFLVPTFKSDSHNYSFNKISQISGQSPQFFGFDKSKEAINSGTDEFYNRFVKPLSKGDNQLSKSVWMSRCLFQTLAKIVEDNGISGIQIYMGAYLDFFPGSEIHQSRKIQSTILIVPTYNEHGSQVPAWGLVETDSTFDKDAAYNHGELCPDNCPPIPPAK